MEPAVHGRSLHTQALGDLLDAYRFGHTMSVQKTLTTDNRCTYNLHMDQPTAITVNQLVNGDLMLFAASHSYRKITVNPTIAAPRIRVFSETEGSWAYSDLLPDQEVTVLRPVAKTRPSLHRQAIDAAALAMDALLLSDAFTLCADDREAFQAARDCLTSLQRVAR